MSTDTEPTSLETLRAIPDGLGRTCAVPGCLRARQRDALYCASHVDELWRSARSRNLPEWLRRRENGTLPGKVLA